MPKAVTLIKIHKRHMNFKLKHYTVRHFNRTERQYFCNALSKWRKKPRVCDII